MPDLENLGPMIRHVQFEPNTGCWLWTAQLSHNGYALFHEGNVKIRVHRRTYGIFKGDPGPTLDHLCRVRCCINPDHLEPVTPKTNLRRGLRFERTISPDGAEICKRGHTISGDNVYVNNRGYEECKECRNLMQRDRRASKRMSHAHHNGLSNGHERR